MIVPWKNIIGSDYEMAEVSDNASFQEDLSGFQSTNTNACLTASSPAVTAALCKPHCYFMGETHRVCSKKFLISSSHYKIKPETTCMSTQERFLPVSTQE